MFFLSLQWTVFFFFSSRRRHTRSCLVSWARRCVQETDINMYHSLPVIGSASSEKQKSTGDNIWQKVKKYTQSTKGETIPFSFANIKFVMAQKKEPINPTPTPHKRQKGLMPDYQICSISIKYFIRNSGQQISKIPIKQKNKLTISIGLILIFIYLDSIRISQNVVVRLKIVASESVKILIDINHPITVINPVIPLVIKIPYTLKSDLYIGSFIILTTGTRQSKVITDRKQRILDPEICEISLINKDKQAQEIADRI
eukprot:TRINITY_DN6893_c0_g1_i10.p2 TRINITY_DN6893_c0_g1~~TRINITY_DN6893_c0_g1_i10.p2  ORF type:complete len:257 (+),score=25.48 TRINITY_DN6893_c0_g1_i10:61-831(+)